MFKRQRYTAKDARSRERPYRERIFAFAVSRWPSAVS